MTDNESSDDFPIPQKGWGYLIASPPEHEKCVVEIYLDGKFVLQVCRGQNSEDSIIEIAGANLKEELIARNVPLEGLISAIQEAKKLL